MNRIALSLSVSIVASLSLGSLASAATLRVPKDFATIQAAVAAANPGDRIKIANGTFFENVFIPAGKDGLVVEGSGKTIVDARPLGGAGSGAAIAGLSNGLVVRRLTVRHGKGAPAIGVFITADGARIERVTALHCEDFGIDVIGDGAVIDRCVVRSSGIGIAVTGNGATIRKSSAQFVGNAGVFVVGNDARIESSTVTASDTDGIFVSGLGPIVTKCTVAGVRGFGMTVFGAGSPTITSNVVRNVREQPGLMVFGATGGLVQSNRISDVAHSGMLFTGGASNVVIRKNRIERSGCGGLNAGIVLNANACSVSENLVRDTGNDGIRCLGTQHVLTKNRVLGNACDGIDVDAGTITLIGNVALGNGGDGIENQGPGADMIGNRALGNRRDISNGGVVSTFENNVYLNGGIGAPAIIDL
ncbi:MAG: right-handed parallel beta-helix repeat-containing protein [Planctomycetes bacterium]|nr:right-handed parallel beta-helix repeat-containing protein [Planctomycetota bacterium]